MSDRDIWRDRLRREPELGREIIEDLPSNHALAEKAFVEDPRLRAMSDEWEDRCGIPREDREREFADEELSAADRAVRYLTTWQ
jgi:hypothetical protein